MMPDDDEPLEPDLREAARAYHEPGPVPRDVLWVRIRAARTATTPDEHGRRFGGRARVILAWGAGIAAVLALGVAIGRMTFPRPGSEAAPAPVAQASAVPAAGGKDAAAYRLATAEHLGQAEAFLTLFRASVREGRQERLASATARELLATNRLLLDSPAGTDARLRFLLQDLELVLAQIAQLAPDRRPEDLELITNGMEQDGMLGRLRAAVPAGRGAPFRQGAL